jgi:dUTP pyrophosphatase
MKHTISAKIPESPLDKCVARSINKVLTKIVPISPEFIPEYEREGDVCCDLKANIPYGGSYNIAVGKIQIIDLGFKMEIPSGWEAQIRCRSGWATKGLMLVNGIGTIDSNFRDNLKIIVTNISDIPIRIDHLDRIAQMAIKPVWYFDFLQVDTLDNSKDRGGGLGSTGIK